MSDFFLLVVIGRTILRITFRLLYLILIVASLVTIEPIVINFNDGAADSIQKSTIM